MKFGQYELLERVAVGGMAEVYRGRVAGAEGFEKWVAIKRILPEFARDDRFISMMLTEARIHSGLSHGNIVQIHDLGISEDGEYFIVLEYVEGHDLRAVMEAATELGVQIPDSLALHVADELAQALHFAHELTDSEGQPLGIIHRDVSPSNVLISNSGEVKLSDFGIAKRRHDHSVVGSLKGNLVYMSPEQAQRVTLDRRTDVFSLGAVLFEMLTGHKLREITDEVNGFRDVASGVVRSARAVRPDLPESYEALLSRALAANPADRFPDAAAFGAAIRALGRESDAPVGPADMKELIELLNPPRRARSPVERSKVIRLGPDFKALAGPSRGTRAGGTTEAAGSSAPAGSAGPRGALAPGMIPAVAGPLATTNGNGNGTPAWAVESARMGAATPEPNSETEPTPLPPLVLSPPASALRPNTTAAPAAVDPQLTPPPPASAQALPRAEIATPVATTPYAPQGSHSRPTARFPPATTRFPSTARFPVATRPPAGMTTPPPPITATVPTQAEADLAMSMPTPPPVPGAFSRLGAAFPASASPVATSHISSSRMSATPPPASTAMGFPPPASFDSAYSPAGFPGTGGGANGTANGAATPAFQTTPSFNNPPLAPSAVVLRAGFPSERPFMHAAPGPATGVVARPRRTGPGLSLLVLLLATLAAGAAVVHYKVVPLEVAVTWLKPASLSITSNPDGSTVTLDGRTLPDKTPLRVDVRRDRAEHVLELSHPGFHSVRTTLRFDRTVALSQDLNLPAQPPPPPPPAPPVVETAPAPAPVVEEPPPAPKTKAQLKAEKKAAKLEAKKEAKAAARASAKGAAKPGKATKASKAAKAKLAKKKKKLHKKKAASSSAEADSSSEL